MTLLEQALLKAWDQACKSTTPAKIVIPKGTYQLKEALLKGPCTAPIELQVHGTVQAPKDPNGISKDMEWIMVEYLDGFTLSGSGTFDGQGAMAWTKNDCRSAAMCNKLANVCITN